MSSDLQQLVHETIELTGASRPDLLREDAPVLLADALAAADDRFYLVGLIGGKDVGKSSLVNALAGRSITQTSSFGAGTSQVIAYVHQSQEAALRELLAREAPGQHQIVTHQIDQLQRQVLLDLPDIDSHYATHLQVTRRMLRHMLFPIWMVSVEKYADQQPQQMLARVAAGNATENFIFCLNKADQLSTRGGPGAAEELRGDYAARVQRTLGLDDPPRVHLISATHPAEFDLPELRSLLSRQRTPQAVRASQTLAQQRQDRTLLQWLTQQQLPLRAQRLSQLQQDAQEMAADRIIEPIVEQIIPQLLDDPATRGGMSEEILTERVARWPLVRLVHTLLSPLFVLLRGAVSRSAAPMQSPEGLVEMALRQSGYSISDLVQTTFAQLRQMQPSLADLYPHRKLWEQMSADSAAAELRRALASSIQRQRDVARQRLTRGGWATAPIRWLLTIGALLWFPFVQPVLHALLGGYNASTWERRFALAVEVLGVNSLLTSAGFLILYYVALWLALRWNTQRRVARLLGRWKLASIDDPELSLAAQSIAWLDDLLSPIRSAQQRMQSLSQRVQELQIGARAA